MSVSKPKSSTEAGRRFDVIDAATPPEPEMPTAGIALPPNPFGLLQMAIEKGMGADELGKLMDLAERWQKLQARQAHAAALAGFQADCPPVFKCRTADVQGKFSYQFASYDDVNRAAKPHLVKWGLSVSFDTASPKANVVTVTCKVAHEQGHEEKTTLEVPIPVMSVNDTQRFGAAISYAKRFAMCAALNIVVTDEDVDGVGLEAITADEAAEVQALVKQCGNAIHMARFFDFAEADTIRDIPGRNLEKVKRLLNQKIADIRRDG